MVTFCDFCRGNYNFFHLNNLETASKEQILKFQQCTSLMIYRQVRNMAEF